MDPFKKKTIKSKEFKKFYIFVNQKINFDI